MTTFAIVVLTAILAYLAGGFTVAWLMFGNPVPWKWRAALARASAKAANGLRKLFGLAPR